MDSKENKQCLNVWLGVVLCVVCEIIGCRQKVWWKSHSKFDCVIVLAGFEPNENVTDGAVGTVH